MPDIELVHLYKIESGSCEKSDVGQTGPNNRLKEHRRSYYMTSAVAEHALETNHDIDWSSAKVVDTSKGSIFRSLHKG